MTTIEKTECQQMADDILKRITWYPESYDQSTWQTVAKGFLKKLLPKGGSTLRLAKKKRVTAKSEPTLQNCQTTGCIAGTASIIAGDMPSVTVDPEYFGGYGNLHVSTVITEDGVEKQVQTRGAELLCLKSHETEWLFAAGRSLLEVVFALREISAGKRISCTGEYGMTTAQKTEIAEYRHQLRLQKPRVNYVATNKLVPRHVREQAQSQKAEAAKPVESSGP